MVHFALPTGKGKEPSSSNSRIILGHFTVTSRILLVFYTITLRQHSVHKQSRFPQSDDLVDPHAYIYSASFPRNMIDIGETICDCACAPVTMGD